MLAVTVGVAAQVLITPFPQRSTYAVGAAVTATVSALASIGAFSQVRRSTGRARWSWWLNASAITLWTASITTFMFDGIIGHITSQPRVGDVVSVIAVCVGLAGLLIAPTAPATWALRARMLVDGAAVAASLFFLLWAPLLRTAYHMLADTVGPSIVVVPSIAIVNLAIVIVLASRSAGGRASSGLHALAGAYALLAVTSLVYLDLVVLQGEPWYTNAPFGGVLTASLLLALATREGLPDAQESLPGPVTSVKTALPYMPVALAFSVAIVIQTRHRLDDVQVWAVLLIAALVLIRQFLTVRTNMKLMDSLRHQRAQLAHQATHDTLTGLPNRALLHDRVAAWPAGAPMGVLMIDLDKFKDINDWLGHAAGDQYLVVAADRLRRSLRPVDTVARLGGDEFVVLVAEVAEHQVTSEAAQRIMAAFAEPFECEGEILTIGASIGIAVGTGNADAVVRAADQALYDSKAGGRNQVSVSKAKTADMRMSDPNPRIGIRHGVA